MRYLLFAGNYPGGGWADAANRGGWDDFILSSNDVEHCRVMFNAESYAWRHIVDTETMEIIEQSL